MLQMIILSWNERKNCSGIIDLENFVCFNTSGKSSVQLQLHEGSGSEKCILYTVGWLDKGFSSLYRMIWPKTMTTLALLNAIHLCNHCTVPT